MSDTAVRTPPVPRGFRGPAACEHAHITYRQLDYWARTGLVVPSVRPAHGSGSQRLYAREDVIDLAVVKTLLDVGCSLQLVRVVLPQLRADRLAPIEVPGTLTFRDTGDYVTLTVDVEAIAARIPEPPDEPGTQGAPEEDRPSLTLVP